MNLLQSELNRCIVLFSTKILESNDLYAQSVLIEILIRLDFILQKLDQTGKRVCFSDDVQERDITDLVNNMRNAVCHTESGRNKIGSNVLMYNLFLGYCPNAISIGEFKIGCNYEDDIAFNFGRKIIYLHRHLERLLIELAPLVTTIDTE